jgi:predicted nucleic acid-binding protein
MNRVFADTFYFLALLNPRDAADSRAKAFTLSFQGEMITTAWVLIELADALSQPANRMKFIETFNRLQQHDQSRIVGPDLDLFEQGIKLFESRSDKEWSLTDCISFLVLAREGITEALTGDHHFEQAGFVALLK